jgi:integrase
MRCGEWVPVPVRRGEKWEGRLKIGGLVVTTRRFETKRAATEWERRQRGAFDEHGYDPSRGKVAVEVLLADWLEERKGRVSRTTLSTDRYLMPTPGQRLGRTGTETILPIWLRKLHVGKVTGTAISAWQDGLLARGLAPTSVKRHRESLSSFFAWCVAEGYVAVNPVKSAPPPKDRRAREDMRPLPAQEFEEVLAKVAEAGQVYADLVSVLGRTGIRWGEARAMLVSDFIEVPIEVNSKYHPDGQLDYDDVESLRKPFAGRTRSCWSPERSPESASRSTGMRSIRQLRPVALRWAAKARQSRG